MIVNVISNININCIRKQYKLRATMVRVKGLKFDFHTNAEKLTEILGEFKQARRPPTRKPSARSPPEIPEIPVIMPVPRRSLERKSLARSPPEIPEIPEIPVILPVPRRSLARKLLKIPARKPLARKPLERKPPRPKILPRCPLRKLISSRNLAYQCSIGEPQSFYTKVNKRPTIVNFGH
jgi:hypothetical protein